MPEKKFGTENLLSFVILLFLSRSSYNLSCCGVTNFGIWRVSWRSTKPLQDKTVQEKIDQKLWLVQLRALITDLVMAWHSSLATLLIILVSSCSCAAVLSMTGPRCQRRNAQYLYFRLLCKILGASI